ncbi:PQQ-binding-like beta-propeller repeat protein [Dyadobacter subterraneus]|uniref:PQQ-binding-like beta-propeller repeat protein n=1 Tax=Dyadobacter subterraneus TaxID=2773304 RepID=A0ABR9WPI8_9BACT|nr:PQQ-binding-like beta-propeller repeat protein [Dyadobacter subterraneus]MBE9466266.1 PQQ-binding-like beta-propeller repeat protein [Dyadobacter subterraneus]
MSFRQSILLNRLLFFVMAALSPMTGISQILWSKTLPKVSTFSSPRVTDLNRDGVKDIVLGVGRLEFMACDSAIIALDGKTGELLWKNPARDQIFGSALLKDLNKDGVEDVIIGGRVGELQAINGNTGAIIWEFDKKTPSQKSKKWYNFYNPQLIPDQDGDGMEDLLISNGGDVTVKPYDPKRPPGKLVVLSSATGKLIAEAMMPDGKETYMSVSVSKHFANDDYRVIFGTGGETIGGNLFVGSLKDILSGSLASAVKIATSPDKGFIAPAVWVEITGDDIPDIVANAVDGRVLAFDGKTLAPLWSVKIPNSEAYTSIAVGDFTPDKIPDFFVSVAKGKWPALETTEQYMINGKSGEVAFKDSIGKYQTSTPVAVDIDADDQEEIIMSVNYEAQDQFGRKEFLNTLAVVGFKTNEVVELLNGLPGQNLSSTPWIGDIDNDNMLDIVFCSSNNKHRTYSFDGMQVSLIRTGINITKPIRWGAYMGTYYDGVFHPDKK